MHSGELEVLQLDKNRYILKVSAEVCSMILSPSLVGEAIGMGADQLVDVKVASHTKLDSHADMTVVGKIVCASRNRKLLCHLVHSP